MGIQEVLLFVLLMSGVVWAFYKLLTDKVDNDEIIGSGDNQ